MWRRMALSPPSPRRMPTSWSPSVHEVRIFLGSTAGLDHLVLDGMLSTSVCLQPRCLYTPSDLGVAATCYGLSCNWLLAKNCLCDCARRRLVNSQRPIILCRRSIPFHLADITSRCICPHMRPYPRLQVKPSIPGASGSSKVIGTPMMQ